ncbi:MAG: hypothetical protein ACLTMP_01365 [Eggerthella lenta]
MEHHLPLIGRSPLFANIDAADLAPMLQCLGARNRTFPKGSYLFRVGDRTTAMGIMLEGSVRLEKEDYWGNRSIRIVHQANRSPKCMPASPTWPSTSTWWQPKTRPCCSWTSGA